MPALASAHAAGPIHTASAAGAVAGPLVAYVRNAATGEVTILHGTREIVVHDPELVKRLVHAAR
jgi:hypothetical protein